MPNNLGKFVFGVGVVASAMNSPAISRERHDDEPVKIPVEYVQLNTVLGVGTATQASGASGTQVGLN
ncbi:hypothetical protein A2803_03470 [Candidatus Woesebacteria bacterium RIFCSPHIGHO2_01_FULL_44_21]|uniref:Uncharacterized protein n=1 Tax=Candidatus Woesebacteria bacterium RIFCSPHIGHO2_01_FULL_44_21 TaxID=1802503 RepID=A0A1F7Z084_9BACT|nr:MAG: hypothetical protein A2803_03470 [Candidatus Woesebacteria bacterium RIFCSPHIGHO2_01_FULL_44_21]OGM69111.1 MAG: hypothetical protein A2897_04770 [Candidatus Woesebacteria bacterium RIFCSPLOWO2_01_FULL_44_24b]